MSSPWSRALLDALAALSPVECAGCSKPDRGICDDCRSELVALVTPRALPGGITVFTALRYESRTRSILLAFKEGGRTDVAKALAAPLADAIRRALNSADGRPVEILVVPPSRAGRRRRGYDPVLLLCRKSGHRPLALLAHTRSTMSQKTLGADARAGNLVGSMRSRRSLVGRRFVLVDDVLTTGATFAEATRAVQAAGGEVVAGAALAFTPRLS